jgi:hypothetical protein
MELNDLIMLGACAILSSKSNVNPSNTEFIADAVRLAKVVWIETLRQDREE